MNRESHMIIRMEWDEMIDRFEMTDTFNKHLRFVLSYFKCPLFTATSEHFYIWIAIVSKQITLL